MYNDRYELETKAEFKVRSGGQSPNHSDSTMIAVEGARRLGFVIERLKDPNAISVKDDADWLDKEIQDEKREQRKQELNYG